MRDPKLGLFFIFGLCIIIVGITFTGGHLLERKEKSHPLYIFIIMAHATALAILAELAPSGILPQISEEFSLSPSKGGLMVGIYALASALLTIPLMFNTLGFNRKRLLQAILLLFLLTNVGIGLAKSYPFLLFCRLVGGATAGLLWPMVSAYGSRLVPKEKVGGTIALIMSGGTVGLVLGIPLMTEIGNRLNWRVEFFTLAFISAIVALLVSLFLPSVEGEKEKKNQSLKKYLSNKSMQRILLVTILSISGYYALYVFIVPLLSFIQYQGSVTSAQLIFGLSSCFSIFVSMKLVEKHLFSLIFINILTGILAMVLFALGIGGQVLPLISIFLWGLGFGSLSSLFQTCVAKRLPWGIEMGNAIHSACFNLSIMTGSTVAGMILDSFNLVAIIYFALLSFILSLMVLVANREVFS